MATPPELAAVSRNPDQLDIFACAGADVFTSWWTNGQDWSGLNDNWRNIGAPLDSPPGNITLQSGPIVFDNGVPVGGWSNLTIQPDGSYVFEGHLHDSGFPSYNGAVVWAVKDNLTNTAYTFGSSGHMAGTIESGSRDWNWNVQETSAALQNGFDNFGDGWQWHMEAQVNADWNSVVSAALSAVGLVGTVVGVVA